MVLYGFTLRRLIPSETWEIYRVDPIFRMKTLYRKSRETGSNCSVTAAAIGLSTITKAIRVPNQRKSCVCRQQVQP
jgi:hypothetical protein